jgi:hypothetical protein
MSPIQKPLIEHILEPVHCELFEHFPVISSTTIQFFRAIDAGFGHKCSPIHHPRDEHFLAPKQSKSESQVFIPRGPLVSSTKHLLGALTYC